MSTTRTLIFLIDGKLATRRVERSLEVPPTGPHFDNDHR
jgi:hypothetical protein